MVLRRGSHEGSLVGSVRGANPASPIATTMESLAGWNGLTQAPGPDNLLPASNSARMFSCEDLLRFEKLL